MKHRNQSRERLRAIGVNIRILDFDPITNNTQRWWHNDLSQGVLMMWIQASVDDLIKVNKDLFKDHANMPSFVVYNARMDHF
jgi:hypothetical protein